MARMSAWGGREAGRRPTALRAFPHCLTVIVLLGMTGWFTATDAVWKKNELKVATPAVHIDYGVSFDPAEDGARLWCAISVKPQNFVFRRWQNRFLADMELECSIVKSGKGVLATRFFRDSLLAGDYQQTHETDEYRLYQFRVPVEEGAYRLRVVVRDRISQKEAVWEEAFEVHPPDRRLAVSDLQIAHRGVLFDQNNLKYSRGVVLYPERLFGAPEPQLFYYFEIYSWKQNEFGRVEIQVQLRTPDNRRIPVLHRKHPLKVSPFPVFGSVATDTLRPGKYFLVTTVKSADGLVTLQKAKSFWVFQNPADLRFRDYPAVLAELGLIAGREEMTYLKKIPRSLRQQAVDRFWKLRDPTPHTPANEVMTEFYRRVLFARLYFEGGKWNARKLSDRAKVYIVYGRPDKVLRNSNPLLRKNVEVWIYQRLDIQAIFLDEYGFGDYRLVEPFSLLQE